MCLKTNQTLIYGQIADPALYLPDAAFVCTYLRAWVEVKRFYSLSFDTNEKSALLSGLASC